MLFATIFRINEGAVLLENVHPAPSVLATHVLVVVFVSLRKFTRDMSQKQKNP